VKVRRPGKRTSGPITLPAPEILVMMVRGAIVAVNQANFTENYSVLLGLATPALQRRATAQTLARAFSALRNQKLDLSPALVTPLQWIEPPTVLPTGDLKLAGFFPTRPQQILFAIVYHPIDGFWLIDQLSVTTAPAGAPSLATQAAPAGPPRLPEAATKEAPPASPPSGKK
jgi:hypothetical protein